MTRLRRWGRLVPPGIFLLTLGCGTAGLAQAAAGTGADAPAQPPGEVAASDTAPEAEPGAGAPPVWRGGSGATTGVGLDHLLALPGDRTYTVDRRGGLTQGEWRKRFDEARADLAAEHEALEEAERRMDRAAGGQWQVAPPLPGQTGAPKGETTLDFKTRQEIRRHRSEIERLERRLNELRIEANLAGVPEEWR